MSRVRIVLLHFFLPRFPQPPLLAAVDAAQLPPTAAAHVEPPNEPPHEAGTKFDENAVWRFVMPLLKSRG